MSFVEFVSTVYVLFLRLIGLRQKKTITGEIVLITGSGSGLGRQLALRFAKLGCRLVLWDINASGNADTAKLVKAQGAEAFTYICDVSDRANVYETAKRVKEDVGKVSILVNNAGIVIGKPFLDTPDESIVKVFQVNTLSHFWTCKTFLPEMIADNHGHIVTVSSMGGLASLYQLTDYCASKFANVGFEEALRLELAINGHTGVKTTLVCPFFMDTGMFEGVKSPYVPILTPEHVADKIVAGVLKNETVLVLPNYMHYVLLLRAIFPWSLWFKIYCFLGGGHAMDQFIGRHKTKSS